MAEPLTLELMAELLADLQHAFPRSRKDANPARTIEVYRNNLRGLSGSAVRAAVARSIGEDDGFPHVARLRDLAHAWTRANEATAEARFDVNPRWCAVCRSERRFVTAYRPAMAEGHRVQLTADRQHLLLETFDREVCDCSTPCRYVPDDDVEPLVMRAKDVVMIPQWKALLARAAFVTTGVQVVRRGTSEAAD